MGLARNTQPHGSDSIIDQLNGGGGGASRDTNPNSSQQLASSLTGAGGEIGYDADGNRINYIGVPADYLATRRHAADPASGIRRLDSLDPAVTQQPARYVDGAELDLQKWGTADIARLQIQMVQAGLLGVKEKVRFQIADTATIAAYKELLGYANVHGLTQWEAMDELMSNPLSTAKDGFGLGGAATDPPPTTTTTVNFTDPTTAKVILRNTLEAQLGRAPKPHEIAAFRTALNDQEELYPSVTTTDIDDEGNAIVTNTGDQAPSPDVFADEFARSGKLGGERNVKLAGIDYYRAAMAALGPGGGMLT